MPTPRPFNAPTSFIPSPMTEINQQVLRMQNLTGQTSTSASAPQTGLSAFTQKILGIGNKALNAASSTKPMQSMKAKPAVKAPALPKGVALGQSIANFIPDEAYDSVANEIIRGGLTVLGKDTTGIDNIISGRPVVKSVGTTDFNVNTPEGMAAYQKALKSSKPVDPKKEQGSGLDTKDGKVKQTPDISTTESRTLSPVMEGEYGVNTLLKNLEIEEFTPNQNFDSNQLPTTSNSPYDDFSSEDARVMGMPEEDIKLRESGQAVETVFDKGVESSGQIFKDPGSRAFLDYEGGSMGALRAAERARGMVTVSNQAYIPNPLAGQDGENDFLRIEDSQKRDINAGRITAQDISNEYANRINGADVGSDSQLVDFSNTYETGFGIQPMTSQLVATDYKMPDPEMPDMSKKMGLFYEEAPLFQVSPEIERYTNPNSPFFQMKN